VSLCNLPFNFVALNLAGRYYNASLGSLLCYGRDQSFELADTQSTLLTDVNLFCQPCPADCVDCIYPGYAGKPLLKRGYATASTATSEFVADWFDDLPRVVFECPVNRDACLAEAAPIGNSSAVLDKPCQIGYHGLLCTMCTDGYSLSGMGCDECEQLTPASAIAAAVLFVAAISGIVYLSRSLNAIGGARKLRSFIALLPTLIGDFKVFIGLYQVLCSMGPTLEITYPTEMERFIHAIRGFSNFDIFSIPGLACMFGSTCSAQLFATACRPRPCHPWSPLTTARGTGTVFGKFWVAVSLPPLIVAAFQLIYLRRLHKSKKHISDVVVDEVADSCWEEAQSTVAAAHQNEHTETGWQKKDQVKDIIDPDIAASKIQAAFKGYIHRKSGATDGSMPRHQIRRLMLMRAVDLAVAKQHCTGWAFLMIFLVYPQTCANILAVFHCFTIDENTAHILADFRQVCSGSWYDFHYWTALVFSFLYPIGIPVSVGVVIFRHREEIRTGSGPSQVRATSFLLPQPPPTNRFCRFALASMSKSPVVKSRQSFVRSSSAFITTTSPITAFGRSTSCYRKSSSSASWASSAAVASHRLL
jgi:hypothetical protein